MSGKAATALCVWLSCIAAFAACGGQDDSASEPVPALSRTGAKWNVNRGEHRVFTITNEAGKIHWTNGETDHPFVSGSVTDPREEARLRKLVKQSRHFRDLIHRLQTAGYGVSAADAPEGG